ncbi:cytochrome P450 oxidoreductase [Penicillium freii]|uniref:Cytochrome P450 n=1 Tax=Penicillium freii TaxID=48697 RepID=A0A101M812_PENFR|nr:cytochrome P450 oxidoreductase [Penicillium freii]KUM55545.1 hypothetical protein ACN42_g11714 [Penicillium freii]
MDHMIANSELVLPSVVLASIALFIFRALDPNTVANSIVSYVINKYLNWRYPIWSADGTRPIPTVSYKFPNGKESAKFLHGETVSCEWAKKYGPIYRIWTGLQPEIVLTRPEDIKTTYRDSDTHLKAGDLNAGWVLGELIGDGVGMLSGPDWKRVHTVVAPAFAQKASVYVPTVMARVERHFTAIEKTRMQGPRKEFLLKTAEDLNAIPFWIMSDIVYGQLPSAMEAELTDMIKLRNELWSYTFKGGWSLFSISKLCSPGIRNKLKMFDRRWDEFNDLAYDHVCSQGKTSMPIQDLYKAEHAGRVKRSEFLHSLSESLFTNIDVTMGTYTWILILLAIHPEIQTELREEINQAQAEGTTEAWHRYLSSNTTLLACCIMESGRLRPIANYTYPQYLPKDRVVAGYSIPKSTYFIIDTNALNRRDPGWGDNAEQFQPSRFMNRPGSEHRYRLWRFGFGARQCLAQALADTMLKGLIVHIIARYKVSIPGGLAKEEDWKTRKEDTWFSMAENAVLCEEI